MFGLQAVQKGTGVCDKHTTFTIKNANNFSLLSVEIG
jgi:hypothetical protein